AVVQAGTLAYTLQLLLCNEEMRTPLVTADELAAMKYTSLASTAAGDGEIFYRPVVQGSEEVPNERMIVIKMTESHPLSSLLLTTTTTLVGAPPGYRFLVQKGKFTCSDHRYISDKTEYYSDDHQLVYILPTPYLPPVVVLPNS